MDNHYPVTYWIERIASHFRLIAGMLENDVDMKAIDRANVAFVMQHLATQLEEAVRGMTRTIPRIKGDIWGQMKNSK